jgi:hypothetical protein
MIDRESRARLTELMRQLAAGLITNDQFERSVPRRSADSAIRAIYENGTWFLYDDLHEHRLTGKYRLKAKGRREVARWVLFLQTDLEYEWLQLGRLASLVLLLLSLVTLGLAGMLYRSWQRRKGDFHVWPFIRESDFDKARKQPNYLAGAV